MASSVLSSATVVTKRTSPAQANIIPPLNGLKSAASFPLTRKSYDSTSTASNGVTAQCIKVWPTTGMRKFETLSYLPPLTEEQLAKEVDYLILNKWIPCLEFTLGDPFVTRKYNSSPGYYDGRYWTMWKLPMYGATDSAQVLAEVQEVKKLHPDAFVRIIGFDNVRQVQCISFIAYTPPEYIG